MEIVSLSLEISPSLSTIGMLLQHLLENPLVSSVMHPEERRHNNIENTRHNKHLADCSKNGVAEERLLDLIRL